MYMALKLVTVRRYNDLISKVRRKGNEENIKVTEIHMSKIEGHQDGALKVVNAIKEEVTGGRVTLKVRAPSRFNAHKMRVQKRLGLKSATSTGRVLSPEESGQGPPDQDTSNQESSNPESPGQGPSNQGSSDQGTSNGDTSKQGTTRSAGTRSGGSKTDTSTTVVKT
ncbi:hypothetical protein BASA62_008031 [Batrachochytrium salamandrivorans]|nr:hypothetical protein BASA62_008031 [Batrachochytrium salamandrivorans]